MSENNKIKIDSFGEIKNIANTANVNKITPINTVHFLPILSASRPDGKKVINDAIVKTIVANENEPK